MSRINRLFHYGRPFFGLLGGQERKDVKRERTNINKSIVAFFLLTLSVFAFGMLNTATSDANPLSVRYIHQYYDTPSDFQGAFACAPTCAVMVLADFGKIKPYPHATKAEKGISDYGIYVSQSYPYPYKNQAFTTPHSTPIIFKVAGEEDIVCGTAIGKGAWGYIWDDDTSTDGYKVLENLKCYLRCHDLSVEFKETPDRTEAESIVKQEIDAGRPLIARTKLVEGGHYVVIVGYKEDDGFKYLVNDPFGEKGHYGAYCKGSQRTQPVEYTYDDMKLGDSGDSGRLPRGLLKIQPVSFSIGDQIKVEDWKLKVRTSCSTINDANLIDTKKTGSEGSITEGPRENDPDDNDHHIWWKIVWKNGVKGWSVQDCLEKLEKGEPVEPVPDIKAKGSDGTISDASVTIAAGEAPSIFVSLDPGSYNGSNADWWLAYNTSTDLTGDWYYYVYNDPWWYKAEKLDDLGGVLGANGAQLFGFNSFPVPNFPELSAGNYLVCFAVDLNCNGRIDGESGVLFFDCVTVNVLAAATQAVQNAINNIGKTSGNTVWNGVNRGIQTWADAKTTYCARFVRECFGKDLAEGYGTANDFYKHYEKLIKGVDSNPSFGSVTFYDYFEGDINYGHMGIVDGDGNVISALHKSTKPNPGVCKTPGLEIGGTKYRGWVTADEYVDNYPFSPPQTVTLTVTKAGTGSGTVTSSPVGINCGATCSADFSQGVSVTLTSTPASGFSFGGWSGACTGTGTCTVSMETDKTVIAAFNTPPGPFTLTGVSECSGENKPQIRLTWTSSEGVDFYNIYKNGSVYEGVNSTTFVDLEVTTGISYSYFIRAKNSGGQTDSNTVTVTAACETPPGIFTLDVTPWCDGNDPVNKLEWTGSAGRIFPYEVYRDTSLVDTIDLSRYDDTAITAGTSYTYFVRAKNSAGERDSNTKTVTAKTDCGAPVTPEIDSISPQGVTYGDGGFTLTITGQNFDSTVYLLYAFTNPPPYQPTFIMDTFVDTSTLKANITQNSFGLSPFSNYTGTYYMQVLKPGSSLWGGPRSNTVSFTIFNPVPDIISITGTCKADLNCTPSNGFDVRVNGTGFVNNQTYTNGSWVANSLIEINGSEISPNYMGQGPLYNQIQLLINGSLIPTPGEYTVKICNAGTSQGTVCSTGYLTVEP